MKPPAVYRVSEVAALAGVSVRTLHHYDAIGLLAPSARSGAGYRLYSRDDLLRLQQILIGRELR
jgi:DNA-binding transcriptional MerR regulator